MNYATAKNYKQETIAECVARFREQHGLFAVSRARLWAQWFEGMNDHPMATYYRLVVHMLEIGIELTFRFPNRAAETVQIKRVNFTWNECPRNSNDRRMK